MTALLVVNPGSRTGPILDVRAVIERLGRHGLSVRPLSLRPRQGISKAIVANARGCNLVVVAGGDGTVSASASAIMTTGLPLGILPTGTANDLAHTLGLPTGLDDACDVLGTGMLRTIDVGAVNGMPFFNAATLGLSVAVAQRLTKARKRRWGVLGYGITLVDAWRASHRFRAHVTCDGVASDLVSSQITVGNGARHGGGLQVAPDATIDDAQLDLYSLSPRSLGGLLALGSGLRRGKHEEWAAIHQLHGRDMHIVTEHPMPVSTDGEITTSTPASFTVLPRAVQVMVPQETAS